MNINLKKIVYAGHINQKSADVRKQILISSVFSFLCTIFLSLYGIDGFRTGEDRLAVVVLFFAMIMGMNYLFLFFTGNYQLSSRVIVVLMTLLCLYLLCSGGNKNTGPLWLYILPSLIFYVVSLKFGLLLLSILMGGMCYILFVPDNFLLHTQYDPIFVNRFMGSFFSVSVLACIYEYTRVEGRRELLEISKKFEELSRKDELTDLSNRRDMYEKLQGELNRAERNNQPFCVLLADIDHFKKVNDQYGHECGDYILKHIASIYSHNVQKRDSVARWGGEEFLFILSETSMEQAESVAERLRKAVENSQFIYHDAIVKITTSIGVAEYQRGQSLNEVINIADGLLYRAKSEGRNKAMSK